MNQFCRVSDFVDVYLDHILVASSSEEEHRRHISALFDRLAQHGLTIDLDKCSFGEPTVEILGHRLSASGIETLREKTLGIFEFPKPTSFEALRRFLG